MNLIKKVSILASIGLGLVPIGCKHSPSKATGPVLQAKFAYILENNVDNPQQSYVNLCSMNEDGSIDECQRLIEVPYYTAAIRFTSINDQDYIYVGGLSDNNILTYCPVNSDGTLGECNTTIPAVPIADSFEIKDFNSKKYLYLPLEGVNICEINEDGSVGTCALDPIITGGVTIAFTDVDSGTYAYLSDITDPDEIINQYCSMDENGQATACTNGSGQGDTTAPFSSRIQVINGTKYIYYPLYYSNFVTYCPINENASVGTCTRTPPIFSNPYDMDFRRANNGNLYAYLVGEQDVSYCLVNDDGNLSDCKETNTFPLSTAITFH